MIRFDIGLGLPSHWAGDKHPIDLDFYRHGSFGKSKKHWEVQLSSFDWTDLFDITLDTHWTHRDHGGVQFDITILGIYFGVTVYDERHWNEDEGRWYEPGEEESVWADVENRRNVPIQQSDAYKEARALADRRSSGLRKRSNSEVEILERLLLEIESK